MKTFESSLSPYEDLQLLGMLFTSHITPHTTLGNVQCIKLLLGVCNTKEQGCGSGFQLDPDSIGSVDPYPYSESGSRMAKMNYKSRKNLRNFMF
jgi:hypothetical protein